MVIYKMNMRFNFQKNPKLYSPLVLAFVGDAVYEQFVRFRVLEENPDMPAGRLYRETVKHVRAHAQSESMNALCDMLTDEELGVYKRGRNAKSVTVPKHTDPVEYRRATGFEALIGYVYMTGDEDRLYILMNTAYEQCGNEQM